jgi:phage-related protein
MTTYPTIPITQFYNNAATYDPRAAKVELGKGGVVDRSRIHFLNNTRKSYSISAVLQEKDTLQNFLETNRGKPFEFRYDGANSAGLYICKTWSWDWVVFVDGLGGVWNFSATFEQVFRPGWVSTTPGAGILGLAPLMVSGTGFASSYPFGRGSISIPAFSITGTGEVTISINASSNLTLPTIDTTGLGSLTNNSSGAIICPTVTVSGAGTVIIISSVGEGNLATPPITVSGAGIFTASTKPDLRVTALSLFEVDINSYIDFEYTFRNLGTQALPAIYSFEYRVYLTTAEYTTAAEVVANGLFVVSEIFTQAQWAGAINATYSGLAGCPAEQLNERTNSAVWSAGSRFLTMIIDYNGTISELNESNNILTIPITIPDE